MRPPGIGRSQGSVAVEWKCPGYDLYLYVVYLSSNSSNRQRMFSSCLPLLMDSAVAARFPFSPSVPSSRCLFLLSLPAISAAAIAAAAAAMAAVIAAAAAMAAAIAAAAAMAAAAAAAGQQQQRSNWRRCVRERSSTNIRLAAAAATTAGGAFPMGDP